MVDSILGSTDRELLFLSFASQRFTVAGSMEAVFMADLLAELT